MSGASVRLHLPEGTRLDDPEVVRQTLRFTRAFPRGGPELYITALKELQEAVDAVLVREGARTLQEGGMVAFPTETVYGLGADVRNPQAIERLYRVKGRPGSHPVIVHVADLEGARACVRELSATALALARRFWPGPLTLVVSKAAWVPEQVTGGQDTVGLRVPSHPLALRLLALFGGPVAAPSANRFGKVSPTTAEHVVADLGGDVDLVLDGGPCEVGVESTIVDARGDEPVILRPGGVTREAIEQELGRPAAMRGEESAPRVSGSLSSHYAPRARVEVVEAGGVEARAAALRAGGLKVRVLSTGEVEAQHLYASLRAADAEGADVVLAPRPAEEGLGRAVADRLRRASGPK